VITSTLEGQIIHYRPVPITGLRLGDYEALMEYSPNTYPNRLANVASEYAAYIPHLFMDLADRNHVSGLCLIDLPEPDHPVPTVNVVEIRQIRENSLSTILEESTGPLNLMGLAIHSVSLIHMGMTSQPFLPASEALSSPLAMTSPLVMEPSKL
jgi:hypothetical protein